MENQKQNLSFFKNEDFASTAIEKLLNLSRTILETQSFYVPDEMRLPFLQCKREFLDLIDQACVKIISFRNYNNDYEIKKNSF